ncbi:MAG: pyruvate kinase, partial [Alphaproteobacteria bacterium]|nr:pyruvate kinase [Alphaproteobacteria bacterium]
PDDVVMRVLNGGQIGNNKAVTVDRDVTMPPLTPKDEEAVRIGVAEGVSHFALSFANRGEDVATLRAIVGDDAFVISKIETLSGLDNLDAIAAASNALLIDRGDLSRQVPLEQIPRVQKAIIRRVKELDRKAYVATNLLESMVTSPIPTRAEVNDIYNTLNDGADGLVLAAETAIGDYPIRCAGMIVRMTREYEKAQAEDPTSLAARPPVNLLVEPHGGELVHRLAAGADLAGLDRLPKLTVAETDLLDCEQIALGTYSPLTGFMDQDTMQAVLDDHRLPDGTVWTMPVVLQMTEAATRRFGPGERIALTTDDGMVHSLLDVAEVSRFDRQAAAAKWFGTDAPEHPGVARLMAGGEFLVAGDVRLVERLPSLHRHYELTPSQTRSIFAHKGWIQVVGFHTRNVVHRVHEYIQMQALERTGADGLYISPVIGPKKAGDFLPGPIMRSYQTLLEFGLYPKERVVLGSFQTYSRYSGPREAVFTALCRKNMGCSYFIVGRDHTGVADFYAPDANRRLFDDLGDIGIAPVHFDAIGYNPEKEGYGPLDEAGAVEPISGSQIRDALRTGDEIPDWSIRDLVQDMLREEVAAGRPLFYD